MQEIKHKANTSIAIATNCEIQAGKLIKYIIEQNKGNVYNYVNTFWEKFVTLKNGTKYLWIFSPEKARGCKIDSAFLDLDVDEDLFRIILDSIFIYGFKDNIVIFDSRGSNDLRKLNLLFGFKYIDLNY